MFVNSIMFSTVPTLKFNFLQIDWLPPLVWLYRLDGMNTCSRGTSLSWVKTMSGYRDKLVPIEPIVPLGGFKLKHTVFLGYTDIAAGGIRALLGITLRKEFYNIEIPQLADLKIACESLETLDPRDRKYSPLQIWNLKYEQRLKRNSLATKQKNTLHAQIILVNSLLPPDKCHYVCSKVMDLCTESCVKKLVVLSALRVDLPVGEIHEVYENNINDMPFTKLPSLPTDARINDAFLNTLLQMIRVEYIPANIVIIPAHRVCLGQARDGDNSQHIISLFQETINKVTSISFDREFSFNLVYKGDNKTGKEAVNMMYS